MGQFESPSRWTSHFGLSYWGYVRPLKLAPARSESTRVSDHSRGNRPSPEVRSPRSGATARAGPEQEPACCRFGAAGRTQGRRRKSRYAYAQEALPDRGKSGQGAVGQEPKMILTKFESHIGENILLVVPRVHPVAYHRVKLVGVEAGGGLWIESDELTNQELTDLIRQTAGPAGATKYQ